ncbi:MAG: hypothetical protein E7321_03415 [Clostridiales bacterium]|nr:hypothetical protein [Clostridiales bacterium]
MAFKQPRVPEYRQSDGTEAYIKALILFLKDFCLEAWTASRMHDKTLNSMRNSATLQAASQQDEKMQILNLTYPIDTVYLSVNSENPAAHFGGAWEQIEDGFLPDAGAGHTAVYIWKRVG